MRCSRGCLIVACVVPGPPAASRWPPTPSREPSKRASASIPRPQRSRSVARGRARTAAQLLAPAGDDMRRARPGRRAASPRRSRIVAPERVGEPPRGSGRSRALGAASAPRAAPPRRSRARRPRRPAARARSSGTLRARLRSRRVFQRTRSTGRADSTSSIAVTRAAPSSRRRLRRSAGSRRRRGRGLRRLDWSGSWSSTTARMSLARRRPTIPRSAKPAMITGAWASMASARARFSSRAPRAGRAPAGEAA